MVVDFKIFLYLMEKQFSWGNRVSPLGQKWVPKRGCLPWMIMILFSLLKFMAIVLSNFGVRICLHHIEGWTFICYIILPVSLPLRCWSNMSCETKQFHTCLEIYMEEVIYRILLYFWIYWLERYSFYFLNGYAYP